MDVSYDIDIDTPIGSRRVVGNKPHSCWGCGRRLPTGVRHLVASFPARRLEGTSATRTMVTLRACSDCAPEQVAPAATGATYV